MKSFLFGEKFDAIEKLGLVRHPPRRASRVAGANHPK